MKIDIKEEMHVVGIYEIVDELNKISLQNKKKLFNSSVDYKDEFTPTLQDDGLCPQMVTFVPFFNKMLKDLGKEERIALKQSEVGKGEFVFTHFIVKKDE